MRLPDIFPPFLYSEVRQHHGVIACEGSMFKSKFANALTTMMIGSLGMAAAENKLSIGYGAEAGDMDPIAGAAVRALLPPIADRDAQCGIAGAAQCAWACRANSARIRRGHSSRTPAEYGRKALADAGWDGVAPVLVFCPINPFCWPVKASTVKWIAHAALREPTRRATIAGLIFTNQAPQVDASYEQYLECVCASRGNVARQKHGCFQCWWPASGWMRMRAGSIAERIGGAPVFTSEEYDMYRAGEHPARGRT